ncbi:MAG: hypothetical protein ABFS86_12030 [Planctomycetota bacterium]
MAYKPKAGDVVYTGHIHVALTTGEVIGKKIQVVEALGFGQMKGSRKQGIGFGSYEEKELTSRWRYADAAVAKRAVEVAQTWQRKYASKEGKVKDWVKAKPVKYSTTKAVGGYLRLAGIVLLDAWIRAFEYYAYRNKPEAPPSFFSQKTSGLIPTQEGVYCSMYAVAAYQAAIWEKQGGWKGILKKLLLDAKHTSPTELYLYMRLNSNWKRA